MVSSLFPSAINKTAAFRIVRRIVGATVRRVEQLRRLKNTAVQVTYEIGRTLCSTFVSAKLFEQDFESFRREGASQVTVKRWPSGSYSQTHFECRTVGGDRRHTVRLLGYAVNCSCEDFNQQFNHTNQPVCKHILAVLNHLGHTTLEAYLSARETEARASIFTF